MFSHLRNDCNCRHHGNNEWSQRVLKNSKQNNWADNQINVSFVLACFRTYLAVWLLNFRYEFTVREKCLLSPRETKNWIVSEILSEIKNISVPCNSLSTIVFSSHHHRHMFYLRANMPFQADKQHYLIEFPLCPNFHTATFFSPTETLPTKCKHGIIWNKTQSYN